MKERRFQTRTATLNFDNLLEQSKTIHSRENTVKTFEELPEDIPNFPSHKEQNEKLKKDQIKYNNEIKLLSQQIENLDLGFETGEEQNQQKVMARTAQARFYDIQKKKDALNIFDEHMDIKLNLATNGLVKNQRGTQKANIKITKEPPLVSQILKNTAQVQNKIIHLEGQIRLLESKILNKIRLRESGTQIEFQVLRLILSKEQVEKLEKILVVLRACSTSLEDGIRLSHQLGIDQNMDPLLSEYNEFINSDFNTYRLKSKYLFNELFKNLIQQNFLLNAGEYGGTTLTECRKALYSDKVKAYLTQLKSDVELKKFSTHVLTN